MLPAISVLGALPPGVLNEVGFALRSKPARDILFPKEQEHCFIFCDKRPSNRRHDPLLLLVVTTSTLCRRICVLLVLVIPQKQAASSRDGDTGPFPADAAEASPILKYEDPVLARPHLGFDMGRGHDALPHYVSMYASNEPPAAATRMTGFGGGTRSKRRPYIKDDNTAVLKAIIPNKQWVDEAGEWVQTVSLYPSAYFGVVGESSVA